MSTEVSTYEIEKDLQKALEKIDKNDYVLKSTKKDPIEFNKAKTRIENDIQEYNNRRV